MITVRVGLHGEIVKDVWAVKKEGAGYVIRLTRNEAITMMAKTTKTICWRLIRRFLRREVLGVFLRFFAIKRLRTA